MTSQTLTQEQLHSALNYDAATGIFTWKAGYLEKYHFLSGSVAGSLTKRGYIRIFLARRRYYAHRLAWMYVHGRWPINRIDHINGIGTDNRICNLRECTVQQNTFNRKPSPTNTSGFKGVRRRGNGKFVARIGDKHLGTFSTAEEAGKAYAKASLELHGEFSHYLVKRLVQPSQLIEESP